MDVNFGLFSGRLIRLLAGEEVRLPDPIKQHIQSLQADVEIVASYLKDYQYDLAVHVVTLVDQSLSEDDQIASEDDQIASPLLKVIMEEIDGFVSEFDYVIDTFIIAINQQNIEICSKDICDALLQLQRKISDIKKQLQQVPHITTDVIDRIKLIQAGSIYSPASSMIKEKDTMGLDDRMEELLDILIEGPHQLSIVAIIDSVEVDKSAFTAEAYNSNYVKHYFDCLAWVPVPLSKDDNEMLDCIMNNVVPLEKLKEVKGKNHETKKMILHDYLMNKRYLFVLDDVRFIEVWDQIQEILPDNQNGSRVVILVSQVACLTSFQLENGENIQLDFVPTGGPLKVTHHGWSFLILCHGSMSFENIEETLSEPFMAKYIIVSLFPLYLKSCCLYLSLFPTHLEIPTRQLYQLWIAEGFVPDNSEVTAEQYLEELFDKGFIQVRKRRPDGTIKTCSTLTRWWFALLLVAEAVEFSHTMHSDTYTPTDVKRFSTYSNLLELVLVVISEVRLHSFLWGSPNYFNNVMDWEKIFEALKEVFKHLRVLDLGFLVLNQYSSEIENLLFLRYLKLNIPSLKSLPSSLLSNLVNLYTLDMSSSYIDHTADDIWKMSKLRHLNFGLIKLPPHPGKYCNSLKNLNFISALHPSCCTPDIMSRLPNLRVLKICGDLNYYQSLLSKSLCNLRCLESLKLVNKRNTSSLSKIDLPQYQLPPSLTQLSFVNMEFLDDPMPTLEKLPHLQLLKLKHNTYLGRKLACSSNGFQELKVLHLKSMFWLEEWTMEIGAMRKLQCLIINPCAYLKMLPEQLWFNKSFNKLELWRPQPELRQTLRNFEDKEQYDIQTYPYGM